MIHIVIKKRSRGDFTSRLAGGHRRGVYPTIEEAIKTETTFILGQMQTPAPEPIKLEIWPYSPGGR